MRIRLALVCLLSASTLALTGCIAGFDYTRGSATSASFLYTEADATTIPATGVANSYPAGSTGTSVAATSSASLGANYLGYGVHGDGAGHIYSLGNSETTYGFMVNVYSTANGVLTLTRSLTYSNGGAPIFPQSFAADPTGVVYVSDSANYQLLRFAADATGAATPTIIPATTSFSAMATDTAGDLYAYDNNAARVVEFLADYNGSTPFDTLDLKAIGSTGISSVADMAIDSHANIYLTGIALGGTPFISEYSSVAGTTAPTKTISGSSTLLLDPVAIAVDAVGNIYEEDAPTTSQTVDHANTIYTFPATATGNVAPASQFTMAAPTLAPATFVGLAAY